MTYDEGILEVGETAKIGYYTQENKDLDDRVRVIDYIKDKKEYLEMQDGSIVSASKMLEKFLFPPHIQYAPIGKLSGGEKRRLYLLGILMNDLNVLLLDEPTNDLDIQTLQVLEEYMDGFAGPIVVVSHDRYFLDKTVDEIFELKDSRFTNYPGNYTDYLIRKREEKEIHIIEEKKEKKTYVKAKEEVIKFTYQEKKEYETIEKDIEVLESKLEELELEMQKNASEYGKLNEIVRQKEKLEEELITKMYRWEYLSTLDEKIKEALK
jgi:ATP-binding cassette subfamily F protein uup